MNKGCIVALSIVGILVVGCCGAGIFLGMRYGTPMMIVLVEQSIAEYQELYPDREVETSNAAWFQALTANDSSVQSKDQLRQIAPSGEFVDLYQNPLRLVENPDGSIAAISAGRDKKFDTADDETSEAIMKLMQRAEGAN